MTKAVNLGISLRLGVPCEGSHNQDYGLLGLYLGPLILGNYYLGGCTGAYKATHPVLEEFWVVGCEAWEMNLKQFTCSPEAYIAQPNAYINM